MLYIDIKTSLPIKIKSITHSEGVVGKSDINMNTEIVYSDFEWNVPVEPSDFIPIIPDGYTSAVMDINEDALIKGLKLHAELLGNYPEDLDIGKQALKMSEIMKSETPAAKKLQEQMKEVNKEPDKLRQLIQEFMEPFSVTGTYYITLIIENKDPAYYGNKVSPGDADHVLMRWKVSNNDYMVIFGDLKIEILTKETLVLLEKIFQKQ